MMSLSQKYAVAAAAVTLSMMAASASAAIFLDFEDLGGSFTFVPTSYHGFTWSGANFGPASWVVNLESDNVFVGTEAHSQNHYVWSNGGGDLSIADGTFTMNSMWARVGAGGTGSAIAHGFLGATELFTQTLTLSDSHQLFNLNFVGIDSWTLTNQTANVLIDDVTLNGPVVGSVPEQSSLVVWSLLALTIGGACWWKRSKLAA